MYKICYKDKNGNTQTEYIEDFKTAIIAYIIADNCGIDIAMYENTGYELKSDSYWRERYNEFYDTYEKAKLFGEY